MANLRFLIKRKVSNYLDATKFFLFANDFCYLFYKGIGSLLMSISAAMAGFILLYPVKSQSESAETIPFVAICLFIAFAISIVFQKLASEMEQIKSNAPTSGKETRKAEILRQIDINLKKLYFLFFIGLFLLLAYVLIFILYTQGVLFRGKIS